MANDKTSEDEFLEYAKSAAEKTIQETRQAYDFAVVSKEYFIEARAEKKNKSIFTEIENMLR